MLTVDLVQTYRRGNRISVRRMNRATRDRAHTLAAGYIDIATQYVNRTKEEFDNACSAIEVGVRERKMAAGLRKLVTDRCRFEMSTKVNPATLRQTVFEKASSQRRKGGLVSDFDRVKILAEAGSLFGLSAEEVENSLFADLKNAHRLESFASLTAEQLVALYQKSQGQAVLLRATRVSVFVTSESAVAYRRLFHKLKFLGLLHVIRPLENGGYRIEIDGPFSMFKSVTKYGLKLALLLPILDECGRWKLDAEVLWGHDKRRLHFHLENKGNSESNFAIQAPRLADDITKLVDRFKSLKTEWSVGVSTDILELPGEGLCIPDLAFENLTTGEVVYLEVMGFWSREAVWKRVELVEAGLPYQIIFAVSSRLRVSEEVLGDQLPGSLYVFKGVMNAGRIAELLDAKISRPATQGP